jgi:small subunit ribosomal protein S17
MALNPRRKSMVGRVVSDRMDKTVVVNVERRFRHPLFERVVRRSKKYMAHDEGNACRSGDRVRIQETRPLSKRKRWKVVDILDRQEIEVPETTADEGVED